MTHDDSKERAVLIGEFILENNGTVRSVAGHFGISKSTAHKDLTEKLPQINPALFSKVRLLLEKNKQERHIRGGMATKHKYELIQKKDVT